MPGPLRDVTSYRGVHATVLGLGTFGGGVAAARFLAQRGAHVTITDLRPEALLTESLQQLDDVGLHAVYLGEHPDGAFVNAELLIVNPAVPPNNIIVERCRQRGIVISSEIELFLHHNRAQVVAVTGSNGKSTTAALTHCLLQSDAAVSSRQIRLGGNIGHSLLADVEDLTEDDVAVLELSSFQLYQLRDSGFAPRVAIVTNFAPNHLDWHGTVQHYRDAKQVILKRQRRDDAAVLPDMFDEDDENSWRVRGQHLRFGTVDRGEDGAYVESGMLLLRRGRVEDAVRLEVPGPLPGDHNRKNMAAASCAAWVLGADPDRFAHALGEFRPLEHRLQLVARGCGVRFYDDSVATTPESAIAGLQSFSERCVILAGGADKGVDLTAFAETIRQRTVGAVLMGATGPKLANLITAADDRWPELPVHIATDFPDAFRTAVALVGQAGIVLLSPGCASYGWFRDFRERGNQFAELAREWINA